MPKHRPLPNDAIRQRRSALSTPSHRHMLRNRTTRTTESPTARLMPQPSAKHSPHQSLPIPRPSSFEIRQPPRGDHPTPTRPSSLRSMPTQLAPHHRHEPRRRETEPHESPRLLARPPLPRAHHPLHPLRPRTKAAPPRRRPRRLHLLRPPLQKPLAVPALRRAQRRPHGGRHIRPHEPSAEPPTDR